LCREQAKTHEVTCPLTKGVHLLECSLIEELTIYNIFIVPKENKPVMSLRRP